MHLPTQKQFIDFSILALRWYVAFYMFDYGWSKLDGGQFSVHDPDLLEKPIKDLDNFYITWHLFSQSSFFNVFVGLSQIIGAILLVINRAVIVGALWLIPILIQIFLIDVAFTTGMFGFALPIRIGCMIISLMLILLYYKERLKLAWNAISKRVHSKINYRWWVYLLLPLIGFLWTLFLP